MNEELNIINWENMLNALETMSGHVSLLNTSFKSLQSSLNEMNKRVNKISEKLKELEDKGKNRDNKTKEKEEIIKRYTYYYNFPHEETLKESLTAQEKEELKKEAERQKELVNIIKEEQEKMKNEK